MAIRGVMNPFGKAMKLTLTIVNFVDAMFCRAQLGVGLKLRRGKT
jgi:hypothetical protein